MFVTFMKEIAVLQKVCHPFIAHWFGSFEVTRIFSLYYVEFVLFGDLIARQELVLLWFSATPMVGNSLLE